MTQVGQCVGSAFVYCQKKGLCGASVLTRPNKEGYLSPSRGGIETWLCWRVVHERQRDEASVFTVEAEQSSAAAIHMQHVMSSIWPYALWLKLHVERQWEVWQRIHS